MELLDYNYHDHDTSIEWYIKDKAYWISRRNRRPKDNNTRIIDEVKILYEAKRGQTPFIGPIIDNNIDEINDLISRGFDPNVLDEDGENCLFPVIRLYRIELARILIPLCNINIKSKKKEKEKEKESPLFWEVWKDPPYKPNAIAIAKELWPSSKISILSREEYMDVFTRPLLKKYNIFEEKEDYDPTILKILLENGADPNIGGRRDYSLIYHLISRENYKGLQLMIEYGLDINPLPGEYRTPLVYSIQFLNNRMTRYLLRMGCEIKEYLPYSLIYIASHRENTDAIKHLAIHGAKLFDGEVLRWEHLNPYRKGLEVRQRRQDIITQIFKPILGNDICSIISSYLGLTNKIILLVDKKQ